MSERYCVILVPSTGHAVKIEKLLHSISIVCKLIPIPRHLSSDCGVCVRIAIPDGEKALEIIKKQKVDIEGTHTITSD